MRGVRIFYTFNIWHRTGLLALILLLGQITCRAQNKVDFEIWTDYNPAYKLNEAWRIGGDLGYRYTPNTGSQLGFIRPMVGFRAGQLLSIKLGMANFNVWKDEQNKSFEVRPFTFIQFTWPRFEAIRFIQRLGMEQRWFKLQPGSVNTSDQRFRYLEKVSRKKSIDKVAPSATSS